MFPDIYPQLKSLLPTSTAKDRRKWAIQIATDKTPVRNLVGLLQCESKIATRFAWLLTDIGLIEPQHLFNDLPFLFALSTEIDHFKFRESFANYWLVAGLPEENETEAINLLFDWLQSSSINTTVKSRAIFVLEKIVKKNPDLRNEFILHLEEQKEKYSKDFEKRVLKVIKGLQ